MNKQQRGFTLTATSMKFKMAGLCFVILGNLLVAFQAQAAGGAAVAAGILNAVGRLGPKAYDTIEEYNRTNDRLRSVNDTAIFFEDNNCDLNDNSNMVGSLPLDHTRHFSAKDTTWFRNDEARSVLIWNDDKVEYPPKAGSVITVWDDPDKSLSKRMKGKDDFTVIRILKDFPKGHGVCIGTFEDNYQDKNGYYRITHHHKNGLDGKISFIDSAEGNHGNDARPDDLVFYEDNGCKGGVKAKVQSFKQHDFNCKKVDHCDNDEIRSLLIYDFVDKNTTVRVYDHPDAKEKDDWAKIKISTPDFYGSYCVSTFERDKNSKGVSVDFHKHNDLDGKISHIKVTSKGSAASQKEIQKPEPGFVPK